MDSFNDTTHSQYSYRVVGHRRYLALRVKDVKFRYQFIHVLECIMLILWLTLANHFYHYHRLLPLLKESLVVRRWFL